MPENGAKFIIQQLNRQIALRDAKDGQTDGVIQPDNWNDFAEAVGTYQIPKGATISVKRAEKEISKIFEGDTQEMRDLYDKFLSCAQMASDSGYKIGGELLRISLQKEALTIGKHDKDGYVVLAPDESNEKVKELKIPYKNTKLSREEKRLKAVMYNPDSKVARGASASTVLQSAVQKWFDEGATSDTPIVLKTLYKEKWNSADDIDLGLGVGDCYLAGLKYDNNGTVTGYIQDVYDYSPIYHGTHLGVVTDAVNDACKLQDAGKLHKYRVIIPVTVKVNTNYKSTQDLRTYEESWSDKISRGFTRDQKDRTPNWVKKGVRNVVDGTQNLVRKVSDWVK